MTLTLMISMKISKVSQNVESLIFARRGTLGSLIAWSASHHVLKICVLLK